MTNSTKDMIDLVDVSDLKLTVGHPNGTLAKITHMGNLELNNDMILFNDLKKESLGPGSEIGGLYLFDKEYTRLPSSVLNGKSPFSLVYGREPYISYLKSFGCLCFAAVIKGSDKFSKKCVLIGYASGKKAYKLFITESINVLYSRDVKFYETIFSYKMSVQYEVEHESSKSDVTNLNFFDFVESETTSNSPPRPYDDEEGPSSRDGSENTLFEGTSGINQEVLVFKNMFYGQTEKVSYGLRRSSRSSKLPFKLNEYVLDNKSSEPSSFEEASKDVNWINAMNDEMHAFYENDTW
ncbi:ribonuclease H-like domain-containing protein [Tanacetum coccineum]